VPRDSGAQNCRWTFRRSYTGTVFGCLIGDIENVRRCLLNPPSQLIGVELAVVRILLSLRRVEALKRVKSPALIARCLPAYQVVNRCIWGRSVSFRSRMVIAIGRL
jgi:hypothetical protein